MSINGLVLGGLMDEVRHHPWTTLSSLAALGLVTAVIYIGLPTYRETARIAVRVESLELGQQQSISETLRNREQNLRASLFDLNAKIEEIRAKGAIPDTIYFDELKRLNAEEARSQQQLAAFLAAHPQVASGL